MDPKATLLALDQAVTDGDYVRAVELLNTYYQWRLRGGFEPQTCPRGDMSADNCATRLCDRLENL